MPYFILVILLAAAFEAGAEETTGLSKGPANPADIGTRCGIMAGRMDRAYLPCGPAEVQRQLWLPQERALQLAQTQQEQFQRGKLLLRPPSPRDGNGRGE